MEEERESCAGGGRAGRIYQDGLCVPRGEVIGIWNGESEGGPERGFGGLDGGCGLLVRGKGVDEMKDRGDVYEQYLSWSEM